MFNFDDEKKLHCQCLHKIENNLPRTQRCMMPCNEQRQILSNREKEEMEQITFTGSRKPWGWLGNMSHFPIEFEGKIWNNTEALFQAMRFPEESPIRELIRAEKSPMNAKNVAKGNQSSMSVIQLSEEDVENMVVCLRLKLEQHPELQDKLLSSGEKEIIEDVTSRGRKGSNLFWGRLLNERQEWEGRSQLGKLWMELREELRSK